MRAFIVDESNPDAFVEVERDRPTPGPRDLVVEVRAVALNPVDTKVRKGRGGKVLGWDASGVVVEVGAAVERFAVGDAVYYAGDITRPGCNSDLHAVDERIVGRKPKSLSHLEAACLPLTALTAWEGLYEQLGVQAGGSLLVLNGAGGVGSIVTQLARRISAMTVIATASRPETIAWCEEMGANHIVNHRESLPEQLEAIGVPQVDAIFCCHGTDRYFETMAKLVAPQGRIVSIVETNTPLPMSGLFAKKAGFSWEFMFAKAMHRTPDMDSQGVILDRVAALVDAGTLRHTLTRDGGALTAEKLGEMHRVQASGELWGKLAFSMGSGAAAR